MRCYALEDQRAPKANFSDPSKHDQRRPYSEFKRGGWDEYHPYTNIIWLRYILNYILKHNNLPRLDVDDFKSETFAIRRRMDPALRTNRGAFQSASELWNECIKNGWICQEPVDPEELQSDAIERTYSNVSWEEDISSRRLLEDLDYE